jgi:hypothetical protein
MNESYNYGGCDEKRQRLYDLSLTITARIDNLAARTSTSLSTLDRLIPNKIAPKETMQSIRSGLLNDAHNISLSASKILRIECVYPS